MDSAWCRPCDRRESGTLSEIRWRQHGRTNAALRIRSLHDLLWAPIEKDLPAGTKTVILSPDGELNFVSFATLLSADDKFLIEKYSIRYVASGRDLLREHEVSPTELLAVFGNPAFGSEAELVVQQTETSSPLAVGASEMRDFANMSLRTLPGTDAECDGLKAQAEASGKPIEVFRGTDATEAQLKGINSPRILHLATHGFSCLRQMTSTAGRKRRPD